ncbi:unnamed protein product [Allacma fusca]|uniref:L-2-hydroxyglutarate dehydrogenase, mitochondrial n=1 Tax=Allacma fusca TaxID=39272 RepID=A0A8J2KXX4_9HEXA|nr:unnamed protein product [Allacma fusca]
MEFLLKKTIFEKVIVGVGRGLCSYSTSSSRVGLPVHGLNRTNNPEKQSSSTGGGGGGSGGRSSEKKCYDITIVGGGIVGTATALELSKKYPWLKLAVVEKEDALAKHQSGHNSGVVHCGIYYKPGSLKAQLCVQGLHLSYKYFEENQIPYKKVGKLIVAVSEDEIPRLKDLYERGLQNNVPNLKLVDAPQIKDYEPYCKGLMAVWSPETGIVDWGRVTQSYGDNFEKAGGRIFLNFAVKKLSHGTNPDYPVVVINEEGKSLESKYVLTCGGLQSDRLAEMSGGSPDPRIIPFRGEYLLLNPDKCHLIRGNIYPVPDPRFPFLGVHFTPRMDGSVWLGPNAILALKREGYSWKDFSMKDFTDSIRYKGFQKLAVKYAVFGTSEMIRSAFINLQLKELCKYIPNIGPTDITRGPAGVRAQAMDQDGNLVEDFIFDSGSGPLASRVLHCRNAPSPGATSSLAIAHMIVDKMQKQFSL